MAELSRLKPRDQAPVFLGRDTTVSTSSSPDRSIFPLMPLSEASRAVPFIPQTIPLKYPISLGKRGIIFSELTKTRLYELFNIPGVCSFNVVNLLAGLLTALGDKILDIRIVGSLAYAESASDLDLQIIMQDGFDIRSAKSFLGEAFQGFIPKFENLKLISGDSPNLGHAIFSFAKVDLNFISQSVKERNPAYFCFKDAPFISIKELISNFLKDVRFFYRTDLFFELPIGLTITEYEVAQKYFLTKEPQNLFNSFFSFLRFCHKYKLNPDLQPGSLFLFLFKEFEEFSKFPQGLIRKIENLLNHFEILITDSTEKKLEKIMMQLYCLQDLFYLISEASIIPEESLKQYQQIVINFFLVKTDLFFKLFFPQVIFQPLNDQQKEKFAILEREIVSIIEDSDLREKISNLIKQMLLFEMQGARLSSEVISLLKQGKYLKAFNLFLKENNISPLLADYENSIIISFYQKPCKEKIIDFVKELIKTLNSLSLPLHKILLDSLKSFSYFLVSSLLQEDNLHKDIGLQTALISQIYRTSSEDAEKLSAFDPVLFLIPEVRNNFELIDSIFQKICAFYISRLHRKETLSPEEKTKREIIMQEMQEVFARLKELVINTPFRRIWEKSIDFLIDQTNFMGLRVLLDSAPEQRLVSTVADFVLPVEFGRRPLTEGVKEEGASVVQEREKAGETSGATEREVVTEGLTLERGSDLSAPKSEEELLASAEVKEKKEEPLLVTRPAVKRDSRHNSTKRKKGRAGKAKEVKHRPATAPIIVPVPEEPVIPKKEADKSVTLTQEEVGELVTKEIAIVATLPQEEVVAESVPAPDLPVREVSEEERVLAEWGKKERSDPKLKKPGTLAFLKRYLRIIVDFFFQQGEPKIVSLVSVIQDKKIPLSNDDMIYLIDKLNLCLVINQIFISNFISSLTDQCEDEKTFDLILELLLDWSNDEHPGKKEMFKSCFENLFSWFSDILPKYVYMMRGNKERTDKITKIYFQYITQIDFSESAKSMLNFLNQVLTDEEKFALSLLVSNFLISKIMFHDRTDKNYFFAVKTFISWMMKCLKLLTKDLTAEDLEKFRRKEISLVFSKFFIIVNFLDKVFITYEQGRRIFTGINPISQAEEKDALNIEYRKKIIETFFRDIDGFLLKIMEKNPSLIINFLGYLFSNSSLLSNSMIMIDRAIKLIQIYKVEFTEDSTAMFLKAFDELLDKMVVDLDYHLFDIFIELIKNLPLNILIEHKPIQLFLLDRTIKKVIAEYDILKDSDEERKRDRLENYALWLVAFAKVLFDNIFLKYGDLYKVFFDKDLFFKMGQVYLRAYFLSSLSQRVESFNELFLTAFQDLFKIVNSYYEVGKQDYIIKSIQTVLNLNILTPEILIFILGLISESRKQGVFREYGEIEDLTKAIIVVLEKTFQHSKPFLLSQQATFSSVNDTEAVIAYNSSEGASSSTQVSEKRKIITKKELLEILFNWLIEEELFSQTENFRAISELVFTKIDRDTSKELLLSIIEEYEKKISLCQADPKEQKKLVVLKNEVQKIFSIIETVFSRIPEDQSYFKQIINLLLVYLIQRQSLPLFIIFMDFFKSFLADKTTLLVEFKLNLEQQKEKLINSEEKTTFEMLLQKYLEKELVGF